jgi:hypothetical protein
MTRPSWQLLIAFSALSVAVDRNVAGDARPAPAAAAHATWAPYPFEAGVPLAISTRGIWTEDGVLRGFDGSVQGGLKPPGRRQGAILGVSDDMVAMLHQEPHRPPIVAAFSPTGDPAWKQRWGSRPRPAPIAPRDVQPLPDRGVLVSAEYSGCVKFAEKDGRSFCVKEAAAKDNWMCSEEDTCHESALVRYDEQGRVVDAKAFPGTPGHLFVAPKGDLAAFDGAFVAGEVDLDVGPGKSTVEGGSLADESVLLQQAFLTVFDVKGKWRWGRAWVGDRPTYSLAAFDADGSVWVSVNAEPAPKDRSPIVRTVGLGRGKERPLISEGAACSVLLQLGAKGDAIRQYRACEVPGHPWRPISMLRSARAGGVIVVGPALKKEGRDQGADDRLARMTDRADRPGPQDPETNVTWIRPGGGSWTIELPPGIQVKVAQDVAPDRVCMFLQYFGRHTLSLGEDHATLGEAGKNGRAAACVAIPG